MAKVKCIPRNIPCNFIVNDASLTDLVSLEISENSFESHSDISLLLGGENEISREKQSSDNGLNIISHLLSEDNNVLSDSLNTSDAHIISLGTIAENHLENDRTLKELCFGDDFLLSDVLSIGDDHACVVSFHDSDSVSLDSLASSYILNNSKIDLKNKSEKNASDAFLFNLKSDCTDFESFDCLNDILLKKNQDDTDLFAENSIASVTNGLSSRSSETIKRNDCYMNESSDDELVPDIDLSFCIKKNIQEKHTYDTLSPESVDSRFDEADLSVIESAFNLSEKYTLGGKNCPADKEKITSSKQSLLCKAISVRPKIDNARRIKLQKIRNELCKKLLSASFNNCEQNYSLANERIIDHSDECIITSNFITNE